MGDFVKWAAVGLVALFVWSWLRNSGGAFIPTQGGSVYPNTMIYGRGSSYQQAYGYGPWQGSPQAYAFGGNVPIYADYSPDNGFSFQYGGY